MTDSILLSLSLPQTNKAILNEEIDEMKQLAATLGYKIQSSIIQNLQSVDSSTYFGKGKINSVVQQCNELSYRTLFINDELQPGHFKRIQKIAGENLLIIDRTKLILDIFNDHAKTVEAKKQIELAALEYMMPRLVGQWTHLERQMGGTGTRGGPGEKQIEIDRRLIRRDIDKLKKDLLKIGQSKNTQRKKREEAFCISLAGYTNAGKSSLMNILTESNVYTKNELFATLDSTTKVLNLKISQKILLSDTVGFIQKLPHELVASFQTTLSDIKTADLILKVIDSSYENLSMHIDTIEKTLEELGCSMINSIFIFNKIDMISSSKIKALFKRYPQSIFISCKNLIGLNDLNNHLKKIITKKYIRETIRIRYEELKHIDDIYNNLDVLKRENKDKYILLTVKGSREKLNWVKSRLSEST